MRRPGVKKFLSGVFNRCLAAAAAATLLFSLAGCTPKDIADMFRQEESSEQQEKPIIQETSEASEASEGSSVFDFEDFFEEEYVEESVPAAEEFYVRDFSELDPELLDEMKESCDSRLRKYIYDLEKGEYIYSAGGCAGGYILTARPGVEGGIFGDSCIILLYRGGEYRIDENGRIASAADAVYAFSFNDIRYDDNGDQTYDSQSLKMLVPGEKPEGIETIDAFGTKEDAFNELVLQNEEYYSFDESVGEAGEEKENLMVNNANSFYYYCHLTDAEKAVYGAMLIAAYKPEENGFRAFCFADTDPGSDDFDGTVNKCYQALLYDHPELFWLYNASDISIRYSYPSGDNEGEYPVYFYLDGTYERYAEDMTAFNEAAEAFLAGIDLNAGELDISWQIHDRLIDLVTYNTLVGDDLDSNSYNLAHTAFGALVSDSNGNPNSAVCDGYAQAYVYLMQQAGCEAIHVSGEAGPPDDHSGHSWNMACLDGRWYEIDITWDDVDNAEKFADPSDEPFYTYVNEAISDEAYLELIEHYMYALSTERITEFHTSDEYIYNSNDGMYWVNLVGDSVHIRDSELDRDPALKELIALAPIAE